MTASAQQITPGLIYDDASHTYTLDGVRIPSVTEIIAAAGPVKGAEFFTEESRERGQGVHAAIHYLQDGGLDWSTVDPRIRGYVDAFKQFQLETSYESIYAELPMAHRTLKYGFTPDVPVAFLKSDEAVVIDFKSGAYQPSHAIQIAAYVEGVKSNAVNLGLTTEGEIPKRGLIVSLQADGRYKIHDPRTEKHPITQAQGWAVFQSALTLFRFKEANGYETQT